MDILLPSLVVVFDLAIPVALLCWLWRSRAKSLGYLVSIAALVAVYIPATKFSFIGFWYVVGAFWPYLYAASFGVLVAYRTRRKRPGVLWPKRWTAEFHLIAINVVFTFLWISVFVAALNARSVDEEAVNLSSPFRGGSHLVMGGGGNLSVNQHMHSVRYAMDITRVNSIGRRSDSLSLFPSELGKYSIFGEEIVAPCAGEVIGAENDVVDQPPLQPSFTSIGNYVALHCQGHTIRLLHMKQGSVKVAVGDIVISGQPLGNVGNSGNSVEPHLHIDAVAGRLLLDIQNDGSVKSVPIKINGRFLIKGDSIED